MSYLRRIGHTDAVSERRGERSVVSSGVAGALNGLTQNTSCLQSMAMQQLDIIQETATRVFTMESAVQRILVTAEAHEHQLRAIVPPEKSSEPDSLSANRQQQFQHHLRTLKEQNQKLQKDLDKKTRDNKNLHQMILESGSKRNDIFSDDQISQRLSHLNQAILRIVSRYFNVVEPAGKSGNRIPDTLRIRSEIADNLHRSFFAEDKSLFGLEPGFEEDQQELEQKLLDRGVPLPDLIEWRVTVVRIAMKMETKKTTRGPSREYNYALAAADEMYRTLSAKQPGLAETSLQEDLKKLNVDAWKIALLLRSSRNVYEWDQPVKNFNSYPPEEVERIPLDGISLEELPCRTLFGPLYKVANGEKALVRSGEVLVGP